MEEEKGNTVQVEFTTETKFPEDTVMSTALGQLIDRFGWDCKGTYKVTIEFYPDDEVEDDK